MFGPRLEIDRAAELTMSGEQEHQPEQPPSTRLANKIYSIDQILGHVKKENNAEVKSKLSLLL